MTTFELSNRRFHGKLWPAVLLHVLLLFPVTTKAQLGSGASIPTYHWLQEDLKELQLRQPALQIWTSSLPVRVDSVAHAVQSLAASSSIFSARLKHYFALKIDRQADAPQLLFGGLSSGGFGHIDEAMCSRFSQRFTTALRFSKNVYIHNVVNIDETLRDDPTYAGKKWRGFAAITEQAYGVWYGQRAQLKIGRDFVRWGRGEDATLLISDNSLPMDQLHLQLRTRYAQFSYFSAQLDRFAAQENLNNSGQINRYLSAGRVDFAFFGRTLQVGLSQAALYGRSGGFDWNYLNPFLVFHGEVLNSGGTANSFASIDFSYFPSPGTEFYGELLIDDFQIEKSSVIDLEPDEYGLLFGARFADPFGSRGLTTGIEYTKVKNRTYNSPEFYEKFLHRNRPIGHFLGNDFDRWLLFMRKSIDNNWRIQAKADFRRHGRGRIEAAWDTPWLASTLAEGYSEPFPTGVVEKMQRFTLEMRWHPQPAVFFELMTQYSTFDNHFNVIGAENGETEVRLNIWLEWSKWIRI